MAARPRFHRWRPHPWHGLEVGPEPPGRVHAYVEITPFDLMKYEIDKSTGYLRVDRPQRASSVPPTLYGFVPRTWCGPRVAALSGHDGRADQDPLDICVVSERPISRAELLVEARVIGGIACSDGGEADDKVIAVLANDRYYEGVEELEALPPVLVERLEHYFSTYKMAPGGSSPVVLHGHYGRQHALAVVGAAMADYEAEFGSSHREDDA